VAGEAAGEAGSTGRGREVIAKVAEYAAVMPAAVAIAVGWMWFWMETAPDLADAARLAARAVRALFLGIGWAVVIVRLLL
jgi:hypothetical protein